MKVECKDDIERHSKSPQSIGGKKPVCFRKMSYRKSGSNLHLNQYSLKLAKSAIGAFESFSRYERCNASKDIPNTSIENHPIDGLME